MTKEEHTKSENISLGINFALRGIELIFNIVVIYLTIFKWKRRNFVIQATLWMILTSTILDSV